MKILNSLHKVLVSNLVVIVTKKNTHKIEKLKVKIEPSNWGFSTQETTSLALLKNAVAQRMEAMKVMKAKPMINETPATRKSNSPNPTITIMTMFFVQVRLGGRGPRKNVRIRRERGCLWTVVTESKQREREETETSEFSRLCFLGPPLVPMSECEFSCEN